MKTLLLIRHAKAASYGLVPGDHGRPLSDKGERQTQVLAQQMLVAKVIPDLMLVSSAMRTMQTCEGLLNVFGEIPIKSEEQLYLASAEKIEKQIWLAGEGINTLAIIGHNPGIAMATWNFLQAGTGHQQQAKTILQSAFKTGFAAQFDMSTNKPKLVHLFDPRDSN
ncbi:MAG: histidine phosphatase family protein [Robiginitomaculum sp.]|nr:histidine phosphatase family protein [Robiginitomaculum sp.]